MRPMPHGQRVPLKVKIMAKVVYIHGGAEEGAGPVEGEEFLRAILVGSGLD